MRQTSRTIRVAVAAALGLVATLGLAFPSNGATAPSKGSPQSISLGPVPLVSVGGVGPLFASASSGLPVIFSSQTPAVCSVKAPFVTGLQMGVCSIAVSQLGNKSFAPAQSASMAIPIGPVKPVVAPIASSTKYKITFLPSPDGLVAPTALNNLGQIAGYYFLSDGTYHGFLTGPNGVGIADIGGLGATNSLIHSINDSGMIGGRCEVPGVTVADGYSGQCAFLSGPNATQIHALPALGSDTTATITGLNVYGAAVGRSRNGTTLFERAFSLPVGTQVPIELLSSLGLQTWAAAINDSGQIAVTEVLAGNPLTNADSLRIEPNGSVTKIGSVPGYMSIPTAMNNAGEIAGGLQLLGDSWASAGRWTFYADPNGQNMRIVPSLGGTTTWPYWIDRNGSITGSSQIAGNVEAHAFVTAPHGGAMHDLNQDVALAPGNYLQYAISMNNSGQILVVDALSNVYLLTPVKKK